MERQNGWYLKSNGYMSPNDSYQKIRPMKACTALDNGNHVTFVKMVDGSPVSTVWYVPIYYIGALKAENEKLRDLIFDMLLDEERGSTEENTYYEHVRLANGLGIEFKA